MEFYSSWFDKHNLITRKSFALKRTNQMRRNCINYVEVQVKTTFILVKKTFDRDKLSTEPKPRVKLTFVD